MKTTIAVHENNQWAYYPTNVNRIDRISIKTSGECFFFDPINDSVTAVIPQRATEDDPRAGHLYISLKFDVGELQCFLDDPLKIKGLKEWLKNISREQAKNYALAPSPELPIDKIEEKTKEIETDITSLNDKIALQIMTAIIQNENPNILVMAKNQKDDLIIGVLKHLPKALRKITVSMPWSSGLDLAKVGITVENKFPTILSPIYVVSESSVDLEKRFPDQFAVAKMFFEDVRWANDETFKLDDVPVVCELYNECKKRNLSDENIEKILYDELYKLYKQKAADGNQLRPSDIVNLYILQKIDGNVSNDRIFHLFYKDVISKNIIDIAPDDVLKLYRLLRQEIEEIVNDGKNIQNYSIPNFCKFYAAAIKKDEHIKEIILTSDFYKFYKKVGELYVLEFYEFYKDICVKVKELSDIAVFCKFSRFCTKIVVGANQTNNNTDNACNDITLHDVLDLDFYRFCTDAVNGNENPNEQSKIVAFYRFCKDYAKKNNLKLSDILNLYLYRFYTDTNEISSPDDIVSFYESCKNVAKTNENIKLSDILNLKYYKFYKGYIVTTKQQHSDIVKLYEFYHNIVAQANEHIAPSDIFKFCEFYIKLKNIDQPNVLKIYRFYANVVSISKNHALSYILRIFYNPERIVLTNEFCDFYIKLLNYNNIRKNPFNILNFYKFYSKGKISDIAKSYSAYERGKDPRWVPYLCAILVFIVIGNLVYYNLDKGVFDPISKLFNIEIFQENNSDSSSEEAPKPPVLFTERYPGIQKGMQDFMKEHNITGSVFAYRPSNGDVYCMVSTPDSQQEGNEKFPWKDNKNLNLFSPGATIRPLTLLILKTQDVSVNLNELKFTASKVVGKKQKKYSGTDLDGKQFNATGVDRYPLKEIEEIRCWGNHKEQSVVDGLGNSCDSFFANLAEKIDLAKAKETLEAMDFYAGEPENDPDETILIDDKIPYAKSIFPLETTEGEIKHSFKNIMNFIGEDYLGHGNLLVSPVDMAVWTALFGKLSRFPNEKVYFPRIFLPSCEKSENLQGCNGSRELLLTIKIPENEKKQIDGSLNSSVSLENDHVAKLSNFVSAHKNNITDVGRIWAQAFFDHYRRDNKHLDKRSLLTDWHYRIYMAQVGEVKKLLDETNPDYKNCQGEENEQEQANCLKNSEKKYNTRTQGTLAFYSEELDLSAYIVIENYSGVHDGNSEATLDEASFVLSEFVEKAATNSPLLPIGKEKKVDELKGKFEWLKRYEQQQPASDVDTATQQQ